MVVVLLANGFEELEALTPVDVLRRNNIDVRTVSITNEKLITGTHGIQVATDLIASDVPLGDIDMLILPGGMPGVKNLDASPITKIFIDATLKNGGHLAAICAAPSIFGKHGMLTNIKATCFPGFEPEMLNAILTDTDVITDGVFTTAKDYLAALPFANELVKVCDILGIKPHDESEVIELIKEFDFEDEDEIEDEDEDSLSLEELLKSIVIAKEEEKEALQIPEASFDSDFSIVSAGEISSEDMADIKSTARLIVETLASFGVGASVSGAERGPRITRYSIIPERGVKVHTITNLFDDIALNVAREGIRMQAPIPGKSAIGLEIPNKTPELVMLSDLIKNDEFTSAASPTAVALGKDVAGNSVFADISKFPHALVTGSSGMGKSVCINSILASLIYKSSPEEVKFLLIDPKKVEFTMYSDLPHLLVPVITEAKDAAAALTWAVGEMNRRYGLIESLNVRNIDAYNEKVKADPSLGSTEPKIIIVIDELADLMMLVRGDTENAIMCIAQKARAAGIHLIISTQRPSVSVITGAIKANIPTRITCKLSSQVDSRVVIDMAGAEKLLSRGDMLYFPVSSMSPIRIQGAFISDTDVSAMVNEAKAKYAPASYNESLLAAIKDFKAKFTYEPDEDECDEDSTANMLKDKTLMDAIDLTLSSEKMSTSILQRKLSIGYGKSAKFIDIMEDLGIISGPDGFHPRKVIMTREEWERDLSELAEDLDLDL